MTCTRCEYAIKTHIIIIIHQWLIFFYLSVGSINWGPMSVGESVSFFELPNQKCFQNRSYYCSLSGSAWYDDVLSRDSSPAITNLLTECSRLGWRGLQQAAIVCQSQNLLSNAGLRDRRVEAKVHQVWHDSAAAAGWGSKWILWEQASSSSSASPTS